MVRHTRQNEETGRAELLRAGVIGPAAPLVAGVAVALCANAALAALLGAGMIVNGQPAASSFAAGCAIAGVGVAFTGVAALTSQLSSTARGANGLAMAALAVAFVVAASATCSGTSTRAGLVAYSRLADLALADRLGLRDAPLRRRPLVARSPCPSASPPP